MRIEQGSRVLRVVVDAVQQCNLRCLYCHPGEVWTPCHLDVDRVAPLFAAMENHGVLEVVLSGGEVTLHPRLSDLLAATSVFQRTAGVAITNATRVDDRVAAMLWEANLARVCVSVDGPDDATHGSARGDNRARVLEGLERIRATGVPVTIISVVHQRNVKRVLELSEWLAETGMADQHHLCAPSFSGEAKAHYDDLRLGREEFMSLQHKIDKAHLDLARRGLFVTFNSYWPALGRRSSVVDGGRRITLQQVAEQVKDSLMHVRPDGEVRLAVASWGRETVGQAAIGNIYKDDPARLLKRAETVLADGQMGQLPREVEAQHKFQLGEHIGTEATTVLINSRERPDTLTTLVPIRPLSHLSLLENPLTKANLDGLAADIEETPGGFRLLRHPCGVGLVYDRSRSHVTLLHEAEWPRLVDRLDGLIQEVST